ncbi:MAG: phosphotransferase [Planctomycetes bacterium]|nr:phosphotransferase [Planctomycetota bacterium]
MTSTTEKRNIRVSVTPGHEALRDLLLRPWPDLESASRALPGGRGGVRELPGGLILRRCRRGGALGSLLGDRHASPQPALDELEASAHLLREGVGVAEVVGVRAEKSGLAWRLAVVTRKIENARALRDTLPRPPAAAVARAVRAMHDSGLWHADLNLQNILVTDAGEVRIIDLAGSKVKRPLPEAARLDNLARLYRSMVKQRLAAPEFALLRFLAVYTGRNRAAVERAAAACRGKMKRHRLWWALTGRGR